MMLAASDPLNFILASVWSLILLFCLWLTWYAYWRWKRAPDTSISRNIATRLVPYRERFLLGFALGVTIGVGVGLVLGMFAGHWFWPVEL